MKILLDTDILSFLMRGHTPVVNRAREYLQREHTLSFSIITEYEILRGLESKNAAVQIERFRLLCNASEIVPLRSKAVEQAARIYAALRSSGDVIGDADILIAAIAIVEGYELCTNNVRHFERIENLRLRTWTL